MILHDKCKKTIRVDFFRRRYSSTLEVRIIVVVVIIDIVGGPGGGFGGPGAGFGGPGGGFLVLVAVVACHYFYYH